MSDLPSSFDLLDAIKESEDLDEDFEDFESEDLDENFEDDDIFDNNDKEVIKNTFSIRLWKKHQLGKRSDR